MAASRREPKKKKREPLNTERIAKAALAYIDTHGLEELSLRHLGAFLGVEGMAMYKHYPSKDAILDAVAELLVRELVVPERSTDGWRSRAVRMAQDYRAIAHRHPNAFPLLGMRRFTTPQTLTFVDRVVATLMDEGLSPREAVEAYRAVANWTDGCILNERASAKAQADGKELSQDTVPSELPALAKSFQFLGNAHADEFFRLGLEALLDGLQRRFEASRRG